MTAQERKEAREWARQEQEYARRDYARRTRRGFPPSHAGEVMAVIVAGGIVGTYFLYKRQQLAKGAQ